MQPNFLIPIARSCTAKIHPRTDNSQKPELKQGYSTSFKDVLKESKKPETNKSVKGTSGQKKTEKMAIEQSDGESCADTKTQATNWNCLYVLDAADNAISLEQQKLDLSTVDCTKHTSLSIQTDQENINSGGICLESLPSLNNQELPNNANKTKEVLIGKQTGLVVGEQNSNQENALSSMGERGQRSEGIWVENNRFGQLSPTENGTKSVFGEKQIVEEHPVDRVDQFSISKGTIDKQSTAEPFKSALKGEKQTNSKVAVEANFNPGFKQHFGFNNSEKIENPQPTMDAEQIDAIVQQVVKQTKVVAKEGLTSMQFQLKPENLGKLVLQLVVEKGVISAKFTVQNQTVKQALQNNFGLLRQNLEQQGIVTDRIVVQVNEQLTSYLGQDGFSRGQGGDRGNSNNRGQRQSPSKLGQVKDYELAPSLPEFSGTDGGLDCIA